jgi:uncharacterized damage-inducible protein DinB
MATIGEPATMRDHELSGILDDLERGYNGDAWHGPPLRKVLDGVTAETASSRPIPGGHSIWEIVLHLAVWEGVVVRRIEENIPIESPDEGDFPLVGERTAAAWETALGLLDAQHDRLIQTVSALDPSRLREPVAGKDYTVDHMLRGVAQHMAYHAGQIALLKKLVEAKGFRTGS